MKALVKESGRVRWTDHQRPGVRSSMDVEVQVMRAGICRTDLYVARGLLKSADPVVLGHEFAGVVTAVGEDVQELTVGDQVTASPFVGCGRCVACSAGEASYRCLKPKMIGVDVDGAFAEYCVVPASLIYRIPDSLGFEKGAYVEPVAASLAVVEAGIDPSQRGLIYGGGRIAELTRRILSAHGVVNPAVFEPDEGGRLEECSLDFIVETRATERAMADMVDALKPGGLLVLKSRPRRDVSIDFREVVRKELRLQGAHYGSFEEAIELLASGRLEVADLFGATHEMSEYAGVFEALWSDESKKHFFSAEAVVGGAI